MINMIRKQHKRKATKSNGRFYKETELINEFERFCRKNKKLINKIKEQIDNNTIE